MFYSKTTGGFYSEEIHGDKIPKDAVEISDDEHARLLNEHANGKIIQSDENGTPVAVNRPELADDELAAAFNVSRLAAYRDEADPLFFKSQRGECSIEDWKNKISEIRLRYPK